jgi:hypothetical protein
MKKKLIVSAVSSIFVLGTMAACGDVNGPDENENTADNSELNGSNGMDNDTEMNDDQNFEENEEPMNDNTENTGTENEDTNNDAEREDNINNELGDEEEENNM